MFLWLYFCFIVTLSSLFDIKGMVVAEGSFLFNGEGYLFFFYDVKDDDGDDDIRMLRG